VCCQPQVSTQSVHPRSFHEVCCMQKSLVKLRVNATPCPPPEARARSSRLPGNVAANVMCLLMHEALMLHCML
jgi:hypothetical protein